MDGVTVQSAPRIRIGISGWRYEPWRGVFYPDELPQRLELQYASSIFSTIEINGSFYSLQRPSSWQAWYAETPDDFVFAVKGPRFITHMLRLKEVGHATREFPGVGLARVARKAGADPVAVSAEPEIRRGRDSRISWRCCHTIRRPH